MGHAEALGSMRSWGAGEYGGRCVLQNICIALPRLAQETGCGHLQNVGLATPVAQRNRRSSETQQGGDHGHPGRLPGPGRIWHLWCRGDTAASTGQQARGGLLAGRGWEGCRSPFRRGGRGVSP